MGIDTEKNAATDIAVLLEKIKKIGEGDMTPASSEEFSDPQIAQILNDTINACALKNNQFLIRMNEAMTRIADSGCVKTMLDEINSKEGDIKTLKSVKEDFTDSIVSTEESGGRVIALTKQVRASIDDYGLQCRKGMDAVKKLLDAGGIDRDIENSLLTIAENLSYQEEGLNACGTRVRDMAKEMDVMFSALETRAGRYAVLFNAIDSITHSYEALFTDCIAVGGHIHKISREVDNMRNDMYRQNSWPHIHDRLKIFTVDHLTLTWRLYNYTVEYENLEIRNVNNPDGCKFGLWANSEIEKNSEISRSQPFKDAVMAHYELHDHAVSCFLLRESFKHKEAMAEFEAAHETYVRFAEAMERLHGFVNSLGIFDESEMLRNR